MLSLAAACAPCEAREDGLVALKAARSGHLSILRSLAARVPPCVSRFEWVHDVPSGCVSSLCLCRRGFYERSLLCSRESSSPRSHESRGEKKNSQIEHQQQHELIRLCLSSKKIQHDRSSKTVPLACSPVRALNKGRRLWSLFPYVAEALFKDASQAYLELFSTWCTYFDS